MKKISSASLGLLNSVLFLFLIGCGSKGKSPVFPQGKGDAEHSSAAEEAGIELNQGEKWIVDPAMMSIIKSMEKDVRAFGSEPNQNFTELASGLQVKLEELTSHCTMKGKAHDELHKWLLPFMALVEELSETQDPQEAGRIMGEIQSSLQLFYQYFK